jgi:hypothetical protein
MKLNPIKEEDWNSQGKDGELNWRHNKLNYFFKSMTECCPCAEHILPLQMP